jgi:hypothetical protein
MTYEVDVAGRVQDVELDITWHEEELERRKPRITKCLTDAISSYRYTPPPAKPMRITDAAHVHWFVGACWGPR